MVVKGSLLFGARSAGHKAFSQVFGVFNLWNERATVNMGGERLEFQCELRRGRYGWIPCQMCDRIQ